jgi:hypothetical protein
MSGGDRAVFIGLKVSMTLVLVSGGVNVSLVDQMLALAVKPDDAGS